jgi:spore coat polysaccharide biosynthesis predicted glycosyltransferase SpsG
MGAGHVMRSAAIAEEAIDRGIQCVFIGEITGIPWLSDRVQNLGFHRVFSIDKDFHPSPKSDVLILDSYSIPADHKFLEIHDWLAVINIFDSSTPNYKSQLRIHPGIEKISDSSFFGKTLSGPKYIPIRKNIRRERPLAENGKLRITVIGGGTDVYGFVTAIAKTLKKLRVDFLARVVTTSHIELKQDARFEVLEPSQDVDSIFCDTDVAFTTAGITSFEFLSTGCVVGIACAVENQENNYSLLAELGISRPIGVYANGAWKLESDEILALVLDSTLRNVLRKNAANFIDAHGTKRIVDAILELAHELDDK